MENMTITDGIKGWDDRSLGMIKFAPAFLKLQSELEPVKKDSANPFFKSKYADLSSILEAVQPLLKKHEFMVFQEPGNLGEKLAMTTTIMHVSGEYIRSTVAFPVVKNDPQGYGSAITYARRYSLQSILGLPVVDDDGNAASQQPRQQAKQPVKPAPAQTGKQPKDLNAEQLEWLRHNGKTPEQRQAAEAEISRREELDFNGGN